MRSDTELLSVIFNDSQNQENNPSPIIQSINIDLKNRAIISAAGLFHSDRQSRQAISSLIAAAAEQSGITDTPILSDSIGLYITNQDIVLYNQPEGEQLESARLYLPLEKVKPYLNEPLAPTDDH
jgi:hypothetical protein